MIYEQLLSVGIDSETGRVVVVMLNMHQGGRYAEHCDWELLAGKIDDYFGSVPPQEIEKRQREFEIRKLNELLSIDFSMGSFRSDHCGFVYLMKSGDLYKIGRSKDPDKRFKQLQYTEPVPEEIVHLIESDACRKLESGLHHVFCDKRVDGEWFSLEDGDVEWLKTL